ncbi:uncharacterized protein [Typha latifolia]|uniref:uncharacterized protein n=1 Tax=Typha latifolia TaxID=4733 RepID=UPI003C2D9EFC
MGSWVRTITTPFRKACTVFNSPKEKKPQAVRKRSSLRGNLFIVAGHDHNSLKLHGEVMACPYEDVHIMWSMLDKSRVGDHNTSS